MQTILGRPASEGLAVGPMRRLRHTPVSYTHLDVYKRQEWDKTFPQSAQVDHRKVTFHNRYGITLAADLYRPKDARGKLPALAVSGPFGAVKELSLIHI